MLIVSQNRKYLLNMERAGTVSLSSLYVGHEEGKPVKVLAAFPMADDVTESLGEYESEARAMEVLREIADEYGKYLGPMAVPSPRQTSTHSHSPLLRRRSTRCRWSEGEGEDS